MKRILIALLFAPCLAFAQSSAVQINSAGKIVVPANGTLTSPGTITANNVISNGTATVGNLSTAGTVTAASGTSNGTWTTNALTLTSGNITDSNGDVVVDDSITVTGDFKFSGLMYDPDGTTQIYAGTLMQLATGGGFSGSGFNFYGGNNTTSYIFHPLGAVDIETRDGFKISKTGGPAGTPIANLLSASASIDFANTSAQTTNSGNTITVTGVATTNTPSVEIGLSGALPTGCSVHGIVTGSNTVTLYFVNASASAQDPGAITIRATVTQF